MARRRPAGARGPDRRAARRSPRPPGSTCARSSCAREVAISGANFAVAETGTVMVVESEGNGRMCLTLPEIADHGDGHREARPRRWRDLEVFLQLLPRSSTAERMNPYTSMWTGVTPGDGPQAFHLSCWTTAGPTRSSDTVGRQALRCIRCSACLNVCPVYERTGGQAYGSVVPGPDRRDPHAPAARRSTEHPVDEQTASLPYASSLCGACFDVCPVRIDIPEVLVHLRARSCATARRRTACRRSEEAVRWPRPAGRSATPRRLRPRRAGGGLGGRAVRAPRHGSGGCRDRARCGGWFRRPRPQGPPPASRSGAGGAGRDGGRGAASDGARRAQPRPRRATPSSAGSGRRSATGRRRSTCPRDYERALPAGDGHRRAVRRARRATTARPSTGRRPPGSPDAIAAVLAAGARRARSSPGRRSDRVARGGAGDRGRARRSAAVPRRPRRRSTA